MKKKIHVCLYLNGNEVLNLNNVICVMFYSFAVEFTYYGAYINFGYDEFDRIEIDYYD